VGEADACEETLEIAQFVGDLGLDVWRKGSVFSRPCMAAAIARQHHHGEASDPQDEAVVLALWTLNREWTIAVGHWKICDPIPEALPHQLPALFRFTAIWFVRFPLIAAVWKEGFSLSAHG
jgi:hypothetical protein